ncbi:MAG TPA: extracellular solute-binding protein [Paralcaligenes sp.]
MIKRREFLKMSSRAATGLALAGTSSLALAQSRPASMAMMTWGGLWGNGMAQYVDTPFTKETGIKIIQDRGSSPVERVTKLKINLNNQIYDLMQVHDGVVPLAEKQGVVEELDPNSANLPFLKEIPESFRRPGWVACIYSTLGIVYNHDVIKTPPKGFADLWNDEYRGRIVLPSITHSIGPYIIPIGAMAAGKDSKDADTGFSMLRKMVKLDPIWARDTDTIMSSLLSGEAVIGLLYKSQTYTVKDKGAKVDWVFPSEGAISYLAGTSIAKNTKNKSFAEKYVNMTLDPQHQLWVTKVFNYAGTNPRMLKMLPPSLQERVHYSDAEIARIINLDQDFISGNRAKWTDEWNRIVAGG